MKYTNIMINCSSTTNPISFFLYLGIYNQTYISLSDAGTLRRFLKLGASREADVIVNLGVINRNAFY